MLSLPSLRLGWRFGILPLVQQKVSCLHRSSCIRNSSSGKESFPSPESPTLVPKFDSRRLEGSGSFDADYQLRPDQVKFKGSPYPERDQEINTRKHRQDRRDVEPHSPSEVDDRDNSVILFPGQGSQFVGMGKKLLEVPNVAEMFQKASSLLEFNLLKVCTEGPQSTLDQTLYSQPAVVITSLAAVEKLYQEDPKAVENCVATAGFSVGEITALIFSGALTFDDGIRLVKARAEAMQYCSELEPSGMMAVFFGADAKLSLATEAAKQWIKEKHGIATPVCQVANHLYAGAKVLAGHEQALQFIDENRTDFNIRRTKRLPVSGAFHTPLMQPAVEVLKSTLETMTVHRPRIPVHSNMEQFVFTRETHIRLKLPKQVVKQCKWEQAMNRMFDYQHDDFLPSVYECGPGSALCGILKKINGKAGRRAKFVPV